MAADRGSTKILASDSKDQFALEIGLSDYHALKKLYAAALKSDAETVSYKKHSFYMGYLKYLLEYLDSRIGDKSEVY